MNSDSQIISNPEIKSSLLTIYDKIGIIQSREIGYELFIDLILNNLYLSSTMNFIISQVGDFINSLSPKEKEPYLKLLSLFFYNPHNNQNSENQNQNGSNIIIGKNIYYIYISPVLNILQTFINEQNSILYASISNVYADIVQYTMPTDISVSTKQLDPEEKKAYDVLQGFCIYNMKYDDRSNRIVGSLCLTKLVENCPIVLQPQYTKFIWDNINNFIDKKNFNAKTELLNCLISLILGAENLFCPYANVTLYKVLDFLTDNDWLKRKLALNVIYTLIFYCKDEILPLKDHIINFLKVLKTDKVKEVREVCLLILQIFSQNETNQEKKIENNYSEFSNQKDINEGGNKLIENNNNKIKSQKEMNNFKDSSDKKNKEKISNKKKEIEIEKNRNKTPTNKRKRSIGEDKNMNINNNNNNNNSNLILQNNINANNNPINNVNTNFTFNHTKFVNRKDDNTFINEKMKIRPDPNKSIFRTNPNTAFFNQAKNKKEDIIVMAKGEPMKYNYNEIIEKENKHDNNIKKINEVNENEISNNKYQNEIVTKYRNNKENKRKEPINKKSNNEKNKKVDSVIINKLLLQMNDLSVKQLSLIDVMENIQTNASKKIKDLNDKIFSLNSLVDDLTNELNELKSQNY